MMVIKWNHFVGVGTLAGFLMCNASSALGQTPQGQQSGQQPQPQQQQPPAQGQQPNPAPLSMDTAPAATPEEEKASKEVQQATDPNKRVQLAEGFLQKYPNSKYRPAMYQALVSGYFATQQ